MVQISRSLVGSTVIGMLMSLQEMLPAAEEEGTDLSSLLLVLLHLKHFSTDWSKAKQKRQTAVFIATQPQFRRTTVIRPLPQRFTSLNSSDHSGSVFFFFPNVILPPVWCLSSSSYCCQIVCPRINLVFVFSGEQVSLLLRHPDQPDNAKVLKVAIIGSPNAGKSTLSNQLLGRKVTVLTVSLSHLHTLICLPELGPFFFLQWIILS